MRTLTPWFAFQTEPKCEKKAERLLIQKGYECLLPTYRQRRRWADRTVTIELPLFPTYIFCRFSPAAFGKVVSTSGISRIVGFGGQSAEIPASEIESLQLLARSNVLREPWKYIPIGTVVQVETGPLAGAKGMICTENDKQRLIISVTLLQRSIAVQVDDSTVLSVIEIPQQYQDRLNNESSLALKLVKKTGK